MTGTVVTGPHRRIWRLGNAGSIFEHRRRASGRAQSGRPVRYLAHGQTAFRGADAEQFLHHLLTCRVDNLVDGQIRYGLVCNETGGILDDVLVNRVEGNSFGLVVNASNREKIVDWIARQRNIFKAHSASFDVVVEDHTFDTAMFAVQGPQAGTIVNQVTKTDLSSLRYYAGRTIEIDSVAAFVSRTGYTGEDGYELIVPSLKAAAVWESFLTAGNLWD